MTAKVRQVALATHHTAERRRLPVSYNLPFQLLRDEHMGDVAHVPKA